MEPGFPSTPLGGPPDGKNVGPGGTSVVLTGQIPWYHWLVISLYF
jgi:hypothetical protein